MTAIGTTGSSPLDARSGPADVPDLAAVLARLSALVGTGDREALALAEHRLREDRLRVLVVGEAKRGKSTLINALLGAELLPTGVLPVTAVTTTIEPDDDVAVHVVYANGRSDRYDSPAVLRSLVTEAGNPGNRRRVRAVTLTTTHPLLRLGVELVDTPGTGSVHEHNTATTRGALDQMDAAVFVLSADPPLSAAEREFLLSVRDRAVRVFIVLNKADQLDPADLTQVVRFTKDLVSGVLHGPLDVHVLSARDALRARLAGDRASEARAGLTAFETALNDYLARSGRRDLAISVARSARRSAVAAVEEIALSLRTAERTDAERARRRAEFDALMPELQAQGVETAALLKDGIARLVQHTGRRSHRRALETTASVLDLLDGFAAERPELRGRDLEAQAD